VSSLAITDLIDLCERMQAEEQLLFETLGSWVPDEPDPDRQRRYATAAHRHAWHAELWGARRPAVPLDGPARVADRAPGTSDPAERAAWYDARLAALVTALQEAAGRVDPVLDPGTQRVIDLVAADLTPA